MRIRSLLLGITALTCLHTTGLLAQPRLVVKAFTIANGVQSPTITVASGQYVTAPASSTSSYVYYLFQNTGNQTLTINVANYLGCTFNIWYCEAVPSTIGPGKTVQISMLFGPGNLGTYEGANHGTLTLSTNVGTFILNFQAIYLGDPAMKILSGDNIDITAQPSPYTYSMPSTSVGTPVSRAFTISNSNPQLSVELNLYNYTLTQLQGNCFSLIAGAFPAAIGPNSSEVFRWRMQSGIAGPCKALVSFTTTKSIYPTFSWILSGTVTP